MIPRPLGLETAQGVVTLVLLGLSPWCLALAYAESMKAFGTGDASRRQRAALGAVLVAGALARWLLAPHRLASVFIGYKLTEHAIHLFPLTHYGAASTGLYHALFALLPADHRTLMWLHAVLGVATLPLIAAFTARFFHSRCVGLLAAAATALIPLFVRNDVSESNNVPMLWWLFGGLVLLQVSLSSRRRLPLVAAVPLLALAATARPEAPALVGVLAGAATLTAGRAAFARRELWAAAGLMTLLLIPHLLYTLREIRMLSANGRLYGLQAGVWRRLPELLLRQTVLLRPSLFPAVILAFAALGLWMSPRRRRVLALLLAALPLLALYAVDLDEANMARVEVPAALLVTLAASAGARELVRLLGTTRGVTLALAALLASALPTAYVLFQPTNEATEEALILEARRHLPTATPFILVRPGEPDRREDPSSMGGVTHYHFPDYLMRRGDYRGRLRSMRAFLDTPDFGVPVYFFQGIRCYAVLRGPGSPPPRGANLHPLCAKMHRRFNLEPIFEREVPNYGDVWIRYYPASPTLTVGLYRVRPRVPAPEGRATVPR